MANRPAGVNRALESLVYRSVWAARAAVLGEGHGRLFA